MSSKHQSGGKGSGSDCDGGGDGDGVPEADSSKSVSNFFSLPILKISSYLILLSMMCIYCHKGNNDKNNKNT